MYSNRYPRPRGLLVAQGDLKGLGMVVLRFSNGSLELNGELATDVKVLLQGQVPHGLLLDLQQAPDGCKFIGQVFSQGESPEFLIQLRSNQGFESLKELNGVKRYRPRVLLEFLVHRIPHL